MSEFTLTILVFRLFKVVHIELSLDENKNSTSKSLDSFYA